MKDFYRQKGIGTRKMYEREKTKNKKTQVGYGKGTVLYGTAGSMRQMT